MNPFFPLTAALNPSLPPMSVPTLTEVVEVDVQSSATSSDLDALGDQTLDIEIPEMGVGLVPEPSERSEAVVLQDWLKTAALPGSVDASPTPIPEPTSRPNAPQPQPLHSLLRPLLPSLLQPPLEATPSIDEAAITRRILAQLMPQIDAMLEQRLRLAIAPVLERVANALAQDARDELESALHDVVAEAVSLETARQHKPAADAY